MSRSRKVSNKNNNRRRKTSMKNKKYFAGDYSEHMIDGKPVQCIYPDGTDKSFAAMFGFRKNCSKIPGFVPPTEPAPMMPELSSVPEIEEEEVAPAVTTEPFTNTVIPAVPEPEPVVEVSPPAAFVAPPAAPAAAAPAAPFAYTAPKGGRRRKSKKANKSNRKNKSKKSRKSRK